MGQTVRQAMAYLHTWLGLVLGFVLMACFFFGSLSVFDREIDRWSVPETRAAAAPLRAVDAMLAALVAGVRPDPHSMEHAADEVVGPVPPADSLALSDLWIGTNHRDPMVRVFGSFDLPNTPRSASVDHVHVHGTAILDPATGARLPPGLEGRLALGTGFFFPLHFSLHLEWQNLGIWIVGLAGMAMLSALVSGVVMHRRIFREFFTFRPDKARLRSTLDLHNMTGVLALPFLFVITFSGLLIFGTIWHRHSGCRYAPMPKSRVEFWSAKFRANVDRDTRVKRALEDSGWRVRVIWECETRDSTALVQSLAEFLGPAHSSVAISNV